MSYVGRVISRYRTEELTAEEAANLIGMKTEDMPILAAQQAKEEQCQRRGGGDGRVRQ